MSTFSIQLHQLRFFAYHGLFEEEKILGNEFEVNISMDIEAPKENKVSIYNTIDYSYVHALVKKIFNCREQLLETICVHISTAIKEQFPLLKKVSIQISKLHPPIEGFIGFVSVTYAKEYD